MPKVTVYVRKDDYPKWREVSKKTELIHKALNGDTILPRQSIPPIKNKEDAVNVVQKVFPNAEPLTYKKANWGA